MAMTMDMTMGTTMATISVRFIRISPGAPAGSVREFAVWIVKRCVEKDTRHGK
jgi:hypothetical protein